MLKTRVIPCLLLKGSGLVKTQKFKNPTYLGDPINIVKIFNEKEVDELILLDITATLNNAQPNLKQIAEIAGECFMPLGYGGGIRDLEDIQKILALGVEKVVINTHAVENPSFIEKASKLFGSQSIIVSIDVKKNLFGRYEIFSHNGRQSTKLDPLRHAIHMQEMGAGELMLNSIDRDGMMQGYDIELIRKISESVSIPVIACGGAGNQNNFNEAVKAGASAVAAGSLFVFQGKHRAVLISYPSQNELKRVFKVVQEQINYDQISRVISSEHNIN